MYWVKITDLKGWFSVQVNILQWQLKMIFTAEKLMICVFELKDTLHFKIYCVLILMVGILQYLKSFPFVVIMIILIISLIIYKQNQLCVESLALCQQIE